MHVAKVGYQGTVLPVLLAVWAQSHIERQLRRIVPNSLDLILTPFLTLMCSALIALLLIGPLAACWGMPFPSA
jgi:phosphotransferase system  glucose/maltose/N-acetylglucosamine-specific IIC component